MKLVTGLEMRELDRKAQEEYGVSELVLMENAGVQIANDVKKWLRKKHKNRVLILVGSGNNGGDGLVAARHLWNANVEVRVLFMTTWEKLRPACRTQWNILEKMGLVYEHWEGSKSWEWVEDWIEHSDLILDGIYGTGFHGTLPKAVAELAQKVNQIPVPVWAIDIPSGVEADTGKIWGEAFQVERTITFVFPKPGLFLGAGATYAGEIRVKEIGMPFPLVRDESFPWQVTTKQDILAWLPQRQPNSHKGTYGHVVVIGGSGGMLGAVRMASRSALRTGAGCVTAVVPTSMQVALQTAEMEIMTRSSQENDHQQFASSAAKEILHWLHLDARKNAYVLGPGLGRYPEAAEFVGCILKEASKTMVIDADALMALADQTEILKTSPSPCILTPHPGEMAALTGLSISKIEENRVQVILHYAQEWQAIVVLKGHRTLIAHPDGQLWMNPTGNAGMATAGSGDVLSGLIAGLLAQGMEPFKAAVAAVYLHGAAGDYMAKKVGEHGLIAGDLLKGIPKVMQNLSKRSKSIFKKSRKSGKNAEKI